MIRYPIKIYRKHKVWVRDGVNCAVDQGFIKIEHERTPAFEAYLAILTLGAALNYGQIELLNLLMDCEEQAPGCVTALSPTLDRYRAAGAARPRIKQYLASPLRFPRNIAGYKYASGPIKRSALVL